MEFAELIIILKRLYKEYVKKHLRKILLALILSIIVAGSTSSIAWLLDPAVKKIFIEQDKVFAWSIPLLIVFAFSSKGLSLYFARINIIRVGEEVAGELQKKIANNILISDLQTLDNRHSGKYISNVMFDAHHVKTLVSTGVLNLMKDTFSVIALVSLMFYQNWKLALFAILMMPLAVGLAKSLGKRIGKATSKAGVSSGNLATFLAEIFKGSKMIRIYQRENDANIKAGQHIDDLVENNIKIGSVMIRATPIMEILTGAMIAGFIIFSGNLIATGDLGINNFFSFLAAMMLAYQPIRSLATINMAAYQGAAAFKRIVDIIDKEIEIKELINTPALVLRNSNIKFNNVEFKYNSKDEKAIKTISLNIKGNTMTAFVGHSGAGKSTIINLLPRFYDPQGGSIEMSL
jgi:subfamily B ATP-binding cassette protein MsbA